jgi:hypothetical protein
MNNIAQKELKDLIEYELVTYRESGFPVNRGIIRDFALPRIGETLELCYQKDVKSTTMEAFTITNIKRQIYFDNPDYKKGGIMEKYVVQAV